MLGDTTPSLGKPSARQVRARALHDEACRLDAAAASLEADAAKLRAAAELTHRRARAAFNGDPEPSK